jgi:hypothetical protein
MPVAWYGFTTLISTPTLFLPGRVAVLMSATHRVIDQQHDQQVEQPVEVGQVGGKRHRQPAF